MGTLRIGTECSGICALSAALDRLQIDVDYAFACECDVHCQKQLRALAVPPKVIYENMETRDAASMPVVDLYVLGCLPMSSSKLENGTRCSSLPLPTTLCVAPLRIILPAELGRRTL